MSNVDMKDKALGEVAPLFIESCQLSSDQVKKIEISTRAILHGLNKGKAELLHPDFIRLVQKVSH